jgi:hypothetical protein
MANLRDHLNRMLPTILPSKPEDSLNGMEVLRRLRNKYSHDLEEYTDATIRVHLSVISSEPNSVIAKFEGGHGYYARNSKPINEFMPKSDHSVQKPEESQPRQLQREEKFRSIYIRYAMLNNEFPMYIDHTHASRQSEGLNHWRFPDVVNLQWDVAIASNTGFQLAKDLFEVKRGLGEPPFTLKSVELKVSAIGSSLREAFFQTVSNSKWAHEAQLVFANQITDTILADELRRLGKSYDISILSYGLTNEYIDMLPSADVILRMDDSQFEQVASNVRITHLASARKSEVLDWEAIRDLRLQLHDFSDLFAWIAYCLEKRTPYRYEDFRQLSRVETKYC